MTAWMDKAACIGSDPEAWFPDAGAPAAVLKSCRECEVTAECLSFALENDIREGVFGGLSARARDRIRRGKRPTKEPLLEGRAHTVDDPVSRTGYRNGCRCDGCREAESSARRRYRDKTNNRRTAA